MAKDIRHRLFLYGSVSAALASFFDIVSVFCTTYFDILPYKFCVSMSSLFFTFVLMEPFIISSYAFDISCKGRKIKKIGSIVDGIIYTIYLIILLINLKTGWVFRYDPELGYVRGPLKNITYILTIVYIFFTLGPVIVNGKSVPKKIYIVFFSYPVISLMILLIQFLNPRLLLTGTAAFATLFIAYISGQSDMIDFDMGTGLLTEHRLEKILQTRSSSGVLCVFTFDNLYSLQNGMDVMNFSKLNLKIGNKFQTRFHRNAYHVSSEKFAVIGKTLEGIKSDVEYMMEYFEKINKNSNYNIPFPLDVYVTCIEFNKGEKSYLRFKEIDNHLFSIAKSEGNHNLKICNQEILDQLDRRRKIYDILNAELRVDSKHFDVYFQPIYSIEENRFIYMEALSRLVDTELGNIAPSEFIPVVESNGLAELLGRVVLEKVCRFISANREVVKAVSVNFSAFLMSNPKIVNDVIELIESYNLDCSSIIIEITESMFIENFEAVRRNMLELSKSGIRFYLDDFGTGYSNISNVIALPFSTIKIDRSLVLMMEENLKNENLFSSLIYTFKSAGLDILVEGVETENQNHKVKKAGADYIQGFLYSKPLPALECIDVISKK